MAKLSELASDHSSEEESEVSSAEEASSHSPEVSSGKNGKEVDQPKSTENHDSDSLNEYVRAEGEAVVSKEGLDQESGVFLVRLPPKMALEDITEMNLGQKPSIAASSSTAESFQLRQESLGSVRLFVPDEKGTYSTSEIRTGFVVSETPRLLLNGKPKEKEQTTDDADGKIPQIKNLKQHFRPIGAVDTTPSTKEAVPSTSVTEPTSTEQQSTEEKKEERSEGKKRSREKKEKGKEDKEKEKDKKKKHKKSSKKEKD
ncbi:DNA-directed RNA polymerase I complex subunit Rpa34 [Schizosaccharomyces cryophilus OY26]|uniref:DNA-directed RNA polymerase I complex subunit Rpa34 n=1 Tax=Schizosaccharomyces cryophilus (strain OY26 / ATCC MYA-4695 / CBS 11777 / NBRC 106824 / NRRL Y48691) TaxID=653667 RepID=S9W304_SCHCR|nr:DNA-directed RNA polymerase I complex subunit Rpa34 [Schizosaccharomyces cryophilus OY26]EPY52944.1 DNA-directed RNA polymerase I complex subunit Rpa34 [Schizosaccharomyces cryophilus OY26]